MKQINQFAGDILLLLYGLQVKNGFLDRRGISFHLNSEKLRIIEGSTLVDPVLNLTDNSVPAAYGAMKYLIEEKLVSYEKGLGSGRRIIYRNLSVTSKGVKLIEDVGKGEAERKQFNLIFNIKLADKITVESLLKAELGSLFKLI